MRRKGFNHHGLDLQKEKLVISQPITNWNPEMSGVDMHRHAFTSGGLCFGPSLMLPAHPLINGAVEWQCAATQRLSEDVT